MYFIRKQGFSLCSLELNFNVRNVVSAVWHDCCRMVPEQHVLVTLCADYSHMHCYGISGHAFPNLSQLSVLLTTAVLRLRLKGFVHCFASHLSPKVFGDKTTDFHNCSPLCQNHYDMSCKWSLLECSSFKSVTKSDSTGRESRSLQVQFFIYLTQTMLLYKTGLVVISKACMLEVLGLNLGRDTLFPDIQVLCFFHLYFQAGG